MPNRNVHIKESRRGAPQSKKFQNEVHEFMDSTSNIHPGDRHREDPEHSLSGVGKKFSTKAIPTWTSHAAEDLKADLLKNKKIKEI